MADRDILWAVYTNTDLTEGRGREYVMHFCKLQATANRLAKRGYVQGTDCPVKPVEVVVLDGQRVLPISIINVEQPTADDEAAQKRIDNLMLALARAKKAGLSDDDISLIRGSRP